MQPNEKTTTSILSSCAMSLSQVKQVTSNWHTLLKLYARESSGDSFASCSHTSEAATSEVGNCHLVQVPSACEPRMCSINAKQRERGSAGSVWTLDTGQVGLEELTSCLSACF